MPNKRKVKGDILEPKRERFVEEVVRGRGQTKCAQTAFPGQNYNSAAVTATRLLQDDRVRQRIREHVAAQSDVTEEEVVGTLVSQMRGDILEAFEDSDSPFVHRLKEKGLGHLIKAVTIRRIVEGSGEVTIPIEVTRIEFHNQQAAATQLSKILGLEQQARENAHDSRIRLKVARAIEKLAQRHFKGDVEKAKRAYLDGAPEHSKYITSTMVS